MTENKSRGGFGITPSRVTEQYEFRQKWRDVTHWHRRHIWGVWFPALVEKEPYVFYDGDEAIVLAEKTDGRWLEEW